jgi:acetyl esterase
MYKALTPAMRSVLERMAKAQRVPLHAMSAHEARAAYALGAGVLELPKLPIARVEDFTIPARDGHALPVRLYAPGSSPVGVLVYLHGGGFTVGSVDTHDGLCRRLSHHSGCAVLSVDYRLAPEHRFPTAHHDAWDALAWVFAQGGSHGLRADRVAVGGDSAGGTLAVYCAMESHKQGLPLALQLLFYPGCAAAPHTQSHQHYGQGFLLEADHIDFFFDQYLRTPADRTDWRFAPLDGVDAQGHEADFSGLAPVWMGLAECDPLVDEGVLLADKLRMAHVAVDLEIYRGVVHEFIKMGRALPEAALAHQHAAQALRHYLLGT